ncbi:MAG: T9SS type A sorting domain-containing protein [Flavobacteriia bacterium]|nr:T9SS type A sorting domain-containing protein [Flavobacteriia bacterium]
MIDSNSMNLLSILNCNLKWLLGCILLINFFEVNAQCAVETLPYKYNFGSPTSSQCWTISGGTPNSSILQNNNRLTISSSGGGLAHRFVITPYFDVSHKAMINFSLRHQYSSTTGFNDYMRVFYQKANSSTWYLLRKVGPMFRSWGPGGTDNTKYFEVLLPDSVVGDTVKFLFRFDLANSSTPWDFGTFRFVRSQTDSVYTLPFSENFDSIPWTPDLTYNNTGIPQYTHSPDWRFHPWSSGTLRAVKWVVRKDSTFSHYTGPLSDKSGTGNYLYTEASMDSGDSVFLYSPRIDLSSVRNPELKYSYFLRGGEISALYVHQKVQGDWIKIDSLIGEQQMNISDQWIERYVTLDSTGESQVRFLMLFEIDPLAAFQQDVAIDEVSIENIACPINRNTNVNFGNPSATSIAAVWDTGISTNNFILEYGPKGSSPSNRASLTVNGNFHLITGLIPNMEYEVFIREDCGSNVLSPLIGPFFFRTECLPISAPFLETFDDTIIPSCWRTERLISEEPNSAWKPTGKANGLFPAYGAQNQIDYTGNGGYCIGVDGSAPTPLDSVFIRTPVIDVSNLQLPQVSFWLFSHNSSFPGDNNTFHLDYFDGHNWNYNVVNHNADSTVWVNITYLLDSIASPDSVQFVLRVDKNTVNQSWYNDILLDNFEVREGINRACSEPLNVQVTFPDCGVAELSWTSVNLGSKIVYGPKGFNPSNAGITYSSVSSPHRLYDLNPGDSVDVYLIDTCPLGYWKELLEIEVQNVSPIVTDGYSYAFNTDSTVTYLFYAQVYSSDSIEWRFPGIPPLKGDTVLVTFKDELVHNYIIIPYTPCGNPIAARSITIEDIGLTTHDDPAEFIISPNPSHGTINIHVLPGSTHLLTYEVYDLSGNLVNASQNAELIGEGLFKLDISHLSSGMYILEFIDDNGNRYKEKLILK